MTNVTIPRLHLSIARKPLCVYNIAMIEFPVTLKELKAQVRAASGIIGNDAIRAAAKVEETAPDLGGWIRLWLATRSDEKSKRALSILANEE